MKKRPIKTRGEQWLLAKQAGRRQAFLPIKREPQKHKAYYQMKIRTLQEDTFEAWEAFRIFCRIHNYKNPIREE